MIFPGVPQRMQRPSAAKSGPQKKARRPSLVYDGLDCGFT